MKKKYRVKKSCVLNVIEGDVRESMILGKVSLIEGDVLSNKGIVHALIFVSETLCGGYKEFTISGSNKQITLPFISGSVLQKEFYENTEEISEEKQLVEMVVEAYGMGWQDAYNRKDQFPDAGKAVTKILGK